MMRSLRYKRTPYPENLLYDLGVSLPPEQYPILEEKIDLLSEMQRNCLLGKYRDKRSIPYAAAYCPPMIHRYYTTFLGIVNPYRWY